MNVPPDLLATWLDEGSAVLVDVREDYEHAEERIAKSASAPLSKFDPAELRKQHPAKRIVFQCRSGKRSADACLLLRASGYTGPLYNLEGGILAWEAAGLELER